jgi:hypothetical protein
MLWFVPTQHPVQMYWFGEFMRRLKQGSTSVTGLLAENPFPDQPPRYLRVLSYRYEFTDGETRRQTGAWWRTTYLGEFPQVPPRRP